SELDPRSDRPVTELRRLLLGRGEDAVGHVELPQLDQRVTGFHEQLRSVGVVLRQQGGGPLEERGRGGHIGPTERSPSGRGEVAVPVETDLDAMVVEGPELDADQESLLEVVAEDLLI